MNTISTNFIEQKINADLKFFEIQEKIRKRFPNGYFIHDEFILECENKSDMEEFEDYIKGEINIELETV